jgi:glycosyltransferase involved in cell wall biosynthesis
MSICLKADLLKLVLAHPGVGPFVQQTARALLEVGLLESYWTMFVDQPNARWRRTLVPLATIIGINLEREFERRAVDEVPAAFLRSAPFWEIVRSLLTKIKADPRLVDIVWERGIFNFDRGVANNSLDDVDGIYGYEYSALASFQEAKKRGLARIYEVPAPEHEFVEDLTQREIEKFPELDDGKRAYFLAHQARRTERRRQEWALADIVIANSTFTRESYAAAGQDVSKVRVIPLGAPPVRDFAVECSGIEHQPLRVLWVGTFSVRKGAHYLLEAWRNLSPLRLAKLEIVGAVALPDKLMRDLPSTVSVSPTVPRIELFERYRDADILAFPTLCDGFGMVVTEAFAHGLPVITTTRAGAADLVRHGENGFIIPAADAVALTEALEWCLTHRAELKSMRNAARETAARWQWSDFRHALARNVVDGLREKGYAT